MVTIPSRLASFARTSGSAAEQRKRALKLYRDWYRGAPEITQLYALSIPAQDIRHAIRYQFEKNRHVSDPKVIDVLLLKGWQEYQEAMNEWKMPDHLYSMVLQLKERPRKTFLQKFYEGRDEEAVLPAASGIV